MPQSERVKRILSSTIHHFNVVVFQPRRDQILYSKKQKPQEIMQEIGQRHDLST